jgi:hypothetical protein
MSKFVKGTLAALLLLSLTAGSALATGISIGVSNASVGFPGWGENHEIGLGAGLNLPFSGGSKQFNIDGRYELGSYKEEDAGDEFKGTVTGFRVRAGVDHVVPVGGAQIYVGSGLSYATHKLEVTETGFPDFESESYSVFGVNSRVGVSGPFSPGGSLSWFGQVENTFGWGSLEEGDVKVTQNDNTNGFQAGIIIHFGQTSAN